LLRSSLATAEAPFLARVENMRRFGEEGQVYYEAALSKYEKTAGKKAGGELGCVYCIRRHIARLRTR
jgi:hypothetical protein